MDEQEPSSRPPFDWDEPATLIDRKALDAGRLYIDHTVAVGAVTQADGFAQ